MPKNKISNGLKKTAIAFILAIGIISLSGCGLGGGTQNNPADAVVTPAPGPTPETGAVDAKNADTKNTEANAIIIQNFAFTPATLSVKKGATVTWTNKDSAPHQIKSTAFNSSIMSNGQSFSFTFNEAGTFAYICSIHPSMAGKIVVE